jgi:hypothetical protein
MRRYTTALQILKYSPSKRLHRHHIHCHQYVNSQMLQLSWAVTSVREKVRRTKTGQGHGFLAHILDSVQELIFLHLLRVPLAPYLSRYFQKRVKMNTQHLLSMFKEKSLKAQPSIKSCSISLEDCIQRFGTCSSASRR